MIVIEQLPLATGHPLRQDRIQVKRSTCKYLKMHKLPVLVPRILLHKELAKLQANLGGARTMTALPQAIFVVDTKREEIGVREANRLHIPVVGLLDTNSDPDVIDYGVPANDDAIRSVSLMCELAADAILAGTGKEQITAEEMAATTEAEPAAEAEAPAAE